MIHPKFYLCYEIIVLSVCSLDGKFLARLREISSNTRTTSDGKATITFKTAKIEANYSPEVIKKIEAGRFLVIPNVMGAGANNIYSIYEVADVYPMHYSMLTLNKNQPGAIRKEFMNLIQKEWQSLEPSTKALYCKVLRLVSSVCHCSQ